MAKEIIVLIFCCNLYIVFSVGNLVFDCRCHKQL